MDNNSLQQSKANNLKIRLGSIIAALVLALIAFFVADATLKTDSEGLRVLTAVCIGACTFFIATGIAFTVFTFLQKNNLFAVIAYASLALGILLLLSALQVKWYYILIVFIFFAVLFTLTSLTVYSRKLTFVADNEKPDYKTYAEKQKEKEEQTATQTAEELPEIKSFKD